MRLKRILAVSLTVAGVLASIPASAQNGATYDVKIVCGKEGGEVVAPGQYWTAVNILNPGKERVNVEAIVATALPGFVMGSLSQPRSAELDADHAMEIDCPSLMELAEASDFLKGYVTIRAAGELVIVAVYTQANPAAEAVSIHTERVPPRAVRG